MHAKPVAGRPFPPAGTFFPNCPFCNSLLKESSMTTKANVQAERSASLWLPVPDIKGEPLTDSRPADLVVVGAGIAGLSVAYQAARDGREVIVLDRGAIGSGMTARTPAHLTCPLAHLYP